MNRVATSRGELGSNTEKATTFGLNLYLIFVVSWFLHLPARVEILAAIRFDLLLLCVLSVIALTKRARGGPIPEADKVLRVLIAYSILTIPFVYWPGSVLRAGLPNFTKAIVFFYFTVAFVRTEADLRRFLVFFIACQMFRVLEPLYLHVTEGYWGSVAQMENWQLLERLSGAPSDVINPNGLAFVVCTVLPFLYFLAGLSLKNRLLALTLIPACLYVLALTGSRSGIVGLLVIMAGVVVKTKSRTGFVTGAVIVASLLGIGFNFLDSDLQDRYLSIFGKGEVNTVTAAQRWEGDQAQFSVVIKKPVVGYGLGTSAEANSNFTDTGPYAHKAMPAHNLYLEIALELGVIGLIIFLFFIKSIFSGFAQSRRAVREYRDARDFLPRLIDAMQVWLAMNAVFSFVSYGLSSYEWYLFGGLSVVLLRISESGTAEGRESRAQTAVVATR